MFVTSDNYDLGIIAQKKYYKPFEWRENLIGGIAFHGERWPGSGDAVEFLLKAAAASSLTDELTCAGYNLEGEHRTRNLKPDSIARTVKKYENRSTPSVTGVLLSGQRAAVGSQDGKINLGGEVVKFPRQSGGMYESYAGYFLFPWEIDKLSTAINLMKIASDTLRCSYAYFYIRDEFCFPGGYASGFSPAFAVGTSYDDENREISNWWSISRNWDKYINRPVIRDIYNLNLISSCYMDLNVDEMVPLRQWISAEPGRGELIELGVERYLWSLDDGAMKLARPILRDAGIILSHVNRSYRVLN
jgi:hypothetical protein